MEADRIIIADAITGLKRIESGTVDTCVTSPPYYGLRDYQTGTWQGGNPECDHAIPSAEHDPKRGDNDGSSSHTVRFNRSECYKCGAKRVDMQIGLEETPEIYIARLVEVFHEVKRVLRVDGTLWVNIGDTYATGTKASRQQSTNPGVGANNPEAQNSVARIGTPQGCKTKDLIGIPWMLAFALRTDGWYLRQDIIWAKPNPMPESVADRCTKSHEYIFLFSKSAKYYYDADAISEDANPKYKSRYNSEFNVGEKEKAGVGRPDNASNTAGMKEYTGKRNKRDVWTVSTKSYKGAHFATFPPDLIRPCIKAGSRVGGIVLDCFAGSGTTAQVSVEEGRQYIAIELNESYKALIRQRIDNATILQGDIHNS